ncbi:unnamed protein product [Lathyrus sativus]|nr:unnamed protein product [Lathyrus sativus]
MGRCEREFYDFWVKWSNVCRHKKSGGLGVRDLRMVNLALLDKWRWRLMSGASGLCFDILFSMYDYSVVTSLCKGQSVKSHSISSWWKEVSLLGSKKDNPPIWFEIGIVKKVGPGLQTSSWKGSWIEGIPLKTRFQRLFTISKRQDDTVGEIGKWIDERISLNHCWRRSFIVYEESMVADFFLVLQEFQFSEENDRCVWRHTRDRLFSVAFTCQIQAGICPSPKDSLSREN